MAVNYHYDKKRFEAFIDAIIAILLTILVLEIRVPESKQEHCTTFEQVISLTPVLIAYIGSFLLIVGFWLDYHLLFVNLSQQLTKPFILLNMLFILSVSFAPFTTAFAGHHYNDSFAVALLAFNYFVMNIFFSFIYWYVMAKKLTDDQFFIDNKGTAIYSMLGILALLISIPMAYVNTYISFAIFLLTFTGHFLKKR